MELKLKVIQRSGSNVFQVVINDKPFGDLQRTSGYKDYLTKSFDVSEVIKQGENIIKLDKCRNLMLHEISVEIEGAQFEVYDTSNDEIQKNIRTILDKLSVGSPVVAATGTKENPKEITAGFIFCDYPDLQGEDNIDSLKAELLGPKDDNGRSELEAFIHRESNGTVKLNIEVYGETVDEVVKPKWVRLPNDHTDYIKNSTKIAADADTEINFPDDWDIAMFAFPELKSTTSESTDGSSATDEQGEKYSLIRSRCRNGQIVDAAENQGKGQKINFTFLDASIYHETVGPDNTPHAHYVTIHELMHAFGLPDLYFSPSWSKLARSYGWSIMSAAGAARHITGYEKLFLGWDSLDDYIFLKNGSVATELVAQGKEGKKGIVVLPDKDAGRDVVYFIEAAQEVGAGKQNMKTFNDNHPNGIGLLVMMVHLNRHNGCIVPFVYERPADIFAERDKFQGASKAPFVTGSSFSSNGISAHSISVSKDSIKCVIDVDGTYRPPKQATQLRENEKIANGKHEFQLTMIGELKINNTACQNLATQSKDASLANADFGFCAYVDNKGNFHLAKAVNNQASAQDILKSWGPSDVELTECQEGESYFFKLDLVDGNPQVAIYKKGKTGEEARQYSLFKKSS
ncbi:MAG: hypothetical protein DWQ10_09380 [Calditrichaeota bacterium]|nr:MAG: hypothetical protein DWQ10_09380 [Calditrichota bacterium]